MAIVFALITTKQTILPPGVIQRLQEYYRTPTHGVSRAYLCTTVDHYAGSYGDKGYGCGYRNFQMLLSSLMTEPLYCKVLFNGKL